MYKMHVCTCYDTRGYVCYACQCICRFVLVLRNWMYSSHHSHECTCITHVHTTCSSHAHHMHTCTHHMLITCTRVHITCSSHAHVYTSHAHMYTSHAHMYTSHAHMYTSHAHMYTSHAHHMHTTHITCTQHTCSFSLSFLVHSSLMASYPTAPTNTTLAKAAPCTQVTNHFYNNTLNANEHGCPLSPMVSTIWNINMPSALADYRVAK